jgi:hypothetical protein
MPAAAVETPTASSSGGGCSATAELPSCLLKGVVVMQPSQEKEWNAACKKMLRKM